MQVIAIRTHPKKQVLLNGLIGVVLGAYTLNDKREPQHETDARQLPVAVLPEKVIYAIP